MVEVDDLTLYDVVSYFNFVFNLVLDNPIRSNETWSESVVNFMNLYKTTF